MKQRTKEIVDYETYEETVVNWGVDLMMRVGFVPSRIDKFDAVKEIREGR